MEYRDEIGGSTWDLRDWRWKAYRVVVVQGRLKKKGQPMRELGRCATTDWLTLRNETAIFLSFACSLKPHNPSLGLPSPGRSFSFFFSFYFHICSFSFSTYWKSNWRIPPCKSGETCPNWPKKKKKITIDLDFKKLISIRYIALSGTPLIP